MISYFRSARSWQPSLQMKEEPDHPRYHFDSSLRREHLCWIKVAVLQKCFVGLAEAAVVVAVVVQLLKMMLAVPVVVWKEHSWKRDLDD